MGQYVLKKTEEENLEDLCEIAKEQNNSINLNLVYMTMKLTEENYDVVMKYFSERGISMIQDDVEPDITAYACEGEKIRPFDPSKIDITMKPLTLDALLKRIRNQEIEFDSSFQRKAGLWNAKQKSQLIESIFLRIPLPAFYFDASDEDKWMVIDGLQRVTALRQFIVEESLTLQDLEFFPELNGSDYKQLPRAFQRRIDETVINVYLVNPSTPDNVKYNIFKRINTGGLALEPQEIRNALYQGNATKFLKVCAEMPCFVTATGGSVKSERMLDREFVLRFVSFCYLDLNKYTGNIDEFLNLGMKYLNKISKEKEDIIKTEFENVMVHMHQLMGKHAFRKICFDGRRRPVNKVIFESWCYVVKNLSNEGIHRLIENKYLVRERYMHLCETNEYLYLLKASDKKSVLARIKDIELLVHRLLSEESR